MRAEVSYDLDGDLMSIEAIVAGPSGDAVARFVLDTGSELTTLSPRIASHIGYTLTDRVVRSVVRSAVGEERGYVVRPARLTALGVTLPDVHVNVADLGYDLDGLLGMNFLCELNLDIRPAERRILVEKIGD